MNPAALFDQFNARYWAGRLKPHRVLLERPPRNDIPASWLGFHDRPTRVIYLRPDQPEWIIRAALFHETIHASGVRWHGAWFWAPLFDWIALRDHVALDCGRLMLGPPGGVTVADVLAMSRDYERHRPKADRTRLMALGRRAA